MSDRGFGTWEEAVRWLIDQPDQQQLVRDCYYDQPAAAAARRYHDSDEWQAITGLLPEHPGKALDVGAGHGITSYALAVDGWSVDALEPDASNLVGRGAIRTLAEAEGLAIDPIESTGECIPFPDNRFDLVLARQVLHHADDLSQLCGEVFRVLKPGGVFIALRDHVVSTPADLPAFLEVHPLHSLYGGEHAFCLSEYLDALRGAGLTIDTVLRPFDSVINYAPLTSQTLKAEIAARLENYPLGGLAARVVCADTLFPILLRLLSRVDRRPGRLYSFVCRKPVGTGS